MQPGTDLPVGTDREERLEDLPFEQDLRRDGRSVIGGVDLVEMAAENSQHLVAHPLNRPDRMFRRDQRLDINQAHKSALGGSLTALSFLILDTDASAKAFSANC